MQIQIASKFKPLFKPKRFKVFFGGRGGMKSWGFAAALEIIGAQSKKRILCTRELQGSIRESVHKLLSDTAGRISLGDFYDVQQQSIKGVNGTEFIFEGLKNNVTKIKSMEGVDIVWCEEAEAIRENSWDLLIPTIRKDGSEIWISFNPADEMDATYQRFVVPYLPEIEQNGFYEDDQMYVCKVGYQDNPWFPSELHKEMEDCKKNNYRKYLHIWEGRCNAEYTHSIIQPEWVESAIDAHKKLGFDPEGVRVLGFDPADEGADAKATVFRHGVVVESVDQWKDGDVSDAITRAFDEAFDKRCTNIVYDGIGVGTAVKVHLKQKDPKGKIEVTNFISSETPSNPDQKYLDDRKNRDTFKNKRAQWFWYLRDRFELTHRAVDKGEYIDPAKLISISSECANINALKSELCRIRRKRGTSNTLVQLEAKKDMNEASYNMADALNMAFANPPPKPKALESINIDTGYVV